ncbi:NB-ARC domain-containing protein [Phormidesmis priestleyi]
MSQPTLFSQIETTLRRETIGQVVVDRYLLSIGSQHGALIAPAGENDPIVDPRPTPLVQVPRAFAGLLGRHTEIESAIAALQAHQTVEFYGEAGIGKTALLRYLSHHPQVTTSHADGILYLKEHQPIGDRLQSLFDTFYKSRPDFKPSESKIRQALKGRQALILVDDDRLSSDHLQQLIAVLPDSTFLVASRQRRFWGEGRAIGLAGLTFEESLWLLERELGRSLSLENIETAQSIWHLLKGHPQRLLQVAALIREDKIAFVQVLDNLQEGAERSLTRMILSSLPKTQRWIVAALVAMKEVGLLSEQIAAITGPPNPQASLQALLQRHLIQMNGYRYCLSSSLGEILQDDFNPTPWMERSLTHLVPWAEQHQPLPEALLMEREIILYSLQWAIEKERYSEALRLVRSLEGALALSKQWETWQRVLHWGLQAAWALENQAVEAWALHQLGTLALCQEDVTTAYDGLSQALALRSTIDDQIGATVTRHNQAQLKATTIPIQGSQLLIFGSQVKVYVALGVIALIVFGISGLVGLTIANRLGQPTVETTVAPQTN